VRAAAIATALILAPPRGAPEGPASRVDDDESVRESLPDMPSEFGIAAKTFSPADQFLASEWLGQTKCLILDIAMPGMPRARTPARAKFARTKIPIVFISAHEDGATGTSSRHQCWASNGLRGTLSYTPYGTSIRMTTASQAERPDIKLSDLCDRAAWS
jgi:CheY-like chemotaxis protein